MKTEEYTDPAAFLAAVKGKKPKASQPDIPRAAADERTGLMPLLRAGWSNTYNPARGYRLVSCGRALDTGWCDSEQAACDRAKELQR